MARYFTNSRPFVDLIDEDEPSYGRTFRPREFWIIWNDWTQKYPDMFPGWDGDEHSEEGWVEKTRQEFDERYADNDAYTYVLQSTATEPKNRVAPKSWREIFGAQEAQ
jgi:hypothetical protein